MDTIQLLSLALGAAWASGINLYAAVLVLGLLGAWGVVELPAALDPLAATPVLLTAAGLYLVEFVVDKVPGLDSLWDLVHSFIRIPAGALLAAGAFSGMGTSYEVAAALVAGAAVAAGTHATKAGSRALINTSPEPLSNWAASLTGDVLVVLGLMLAIFKPVFFFAFFLIFVALAAWLLPRIVRGLRALALRLRGRRSPGRAEAGGAETRSRGLDVARPRDRGR